MQSKAAAALQKRQLHDQLEGSSMYTGIVEPHFRYCCSVWGCCGLTEINHLQKLQNRAARIITGSRYDAPGLPLVKRLGWKTI